MVCFELSEIVLTNQLLPWISLSTLSLEDHRHRTILTKHFQLTPPKPNSATLVNPYKPTSPNSLFSEEQSCCGSRFIGPPKLLLFPLPCGGKVWKSGNTQHTMFYVGIRKTEKRDSADAAASDDVRRHVRSFLFPF